MTKPLESARHLPPSTPPPAGEALSLVITQEHPRIQVTKLDPQTGLSERFLGIAAAKFFFSLGLNKVKSFKQWPILTRSTSAEGGKSQPAETGVAIEDTNSSHNSSGSSTESSRPTSSSDSNADSDLDAYTRGSAGEESDGTGSSFLVIVEVMDDEGNYIPLLALFDTGSRYSFITPETLQTLNIKVRAVPNSKKHGVKSPISKRGYRAQKFVEGRVQVENVVLKDKRVNFRLLPATGDNGYKIIFGWDFIHKQLNLMDQLENVLGRQPMPSVCAGLARDKRTKEQKARDKAALKIVQMNDDLLLSERQRNRNATDGGSWRQTSDERTSASSSTSASSPHNKSAEASRNRGPPQMQPGYVSRVGSGYDGFSRPESVMTRTNSEFSDGLSTFTRRSTADTAMSSLYEPSEYSSHRGKEFVGNSRSNSGFERYTLGGKDVGEDDVVPDHAAFVRSKFPKPN